MLYIQALAAPFTVNTMPEATLQAFADHGEIGPTLPRHARYCDEVLAKFTKAGLTSLPWPPNSRMKGPDRSSSPGTS